MRLAIGTTLVAASLAVVGFEAGLNEPITDDRPTGETSLGFPDCNNNGIDDTVETRVQFAEVPIEAVSNGSIDLADLDGDNDLDLLSGAGLWYENTGGHFALPGIEIFTVAGTWQVRAADMDGDGDLDVVRWNDSVYWHQNLDGLGNFGPPSDNLFVSALGGIESLEIVDIDADADNDLIISTTHVDANVFFWFIYRYKNSGTGFFGEPGQVYSKVVHVQDAQESGGYVHVADVDGDNDPDLISRWGGDTLLEWLANNGSGEFSGPQAISTVAGLRPIRAADLDGDQDNDLLYGRRWYENVDGLGTYGPPLIIGAGETLTTRPSDVDGDGDVDVLAQRTSNDALEWFENLDGLGSFGSPLVISVIPDLEDFLSGDLTGDYTMDVATASSSSGLKWFRNRSGDCNGNSVPDECDVDETDCNGNGVVDECDINSGLEQDCNDNSVPDQCDFDSGTSVDLNGNGLPDECEDCNANGVSDDVDLSSGTSMDCNENFVPDECEDDCNGSGQPDDCDVGDGTSPDCNANSNPDECDVADGTSLDCNANGSPDECDLPDCDGNGVPDECDPDCNGNGEPDGCDIGEGLSEDCDEDGVPDECHEDSFGERDIVPGPTDTVTALATDLDGDGDQDVLAALEVAFNDAIAWYENTDGLGNFGTVQVIDEVEGPASSLVAADLDGDGDADVVAAFPDDGVVWYENTNGSGTFGFQQPISDVALDVRSIDVADLDGDGDMDVLSAGDNEIVWYENLDGLGQFGPQTVITTGGLPVWIHAADLDGDDDPDVLAALEASDEFVWFRNDAGVFQEQFLADASSAWRITAADLDGDGDNDVVTGHLSWVSWIENLGGTGTFGPLQTVSTENVHVSSVFAADLDGDGDRDILAASSFDNEVAWYENTDGVGTFGPQQIISTTEGAAWSVVAADLDGDADVDVLAASDKIAWYENRGDDCDGNGIVDGCDPDCNANGIADACDIRGGSILDCDGNGTPDECEASCGTCDADGDGCLDDTDLDPGNANVCGDVDGDGCDDCSSGIFDPQNDGTDSDSDGVCDAGDCDPFNNEVWYEPAAVAGLVASHNGTTTTFSWSVPEVQGGLEVRYDTLRTTLASDFLSAGVAICIETGDSDQSASDDSLPASEEVYYYLIRIENDCPGDGNLGTDSNDAPRFGLDCN